MWEFVTFIFSVPVNIWNVIRTNMGTYYIFPAIVLLLPFGRRLLKKIIK